MVDANHQPNEDAQPGNPLVWLQLPDPKPGIIESVDRHRLSPRELFSTPILLEEGDAINPFVKVSGGWTVHEMFLHAFGIPERSDIRVDELRAIAQKVQMDYHSRTFSRGEDNNVSSAADVTRLMARILERPCPAGRREG